MESVNMSNLVKAMLFTPGPKGWGLPILLWGPPGVGKSDMIEQVARSYGLPVEILSPGERGEGAFGVVPVPVQELDQESGVMESWLSYPMPDYSKRFNASGRGLVFVDETNTAPPAVQPALLGLIHARRLGSGYLGPGVRVIGAANPTEQTAGGWDLPPALANRFGHIDWNPPGFEQWTDWLLQAEALPFAQTGKNGKPLKAPMSAEAEEARVLAAFPEAYALVKGLVRAFIRARPSLLHAALSSDDKGKNQIGNKRSWPSHRAWDNAVRARAGAIVHGLNEVERDLLVAGFVGEGAAAELARFETESDLINPADFLDGKVKWSHDAKRLDRTMALLSGCVALVSDAKCKDREARVVALWECLSKLMAHAQDLVAAQIKPLGDARLLVTSEQTRGLSLPVLQKLKPLLDMAGI